ncbi:MAG: hypothetical protein ACRDJ5_00800 [Actinomycetota bacterium]
MSPVRGPSTNLRGTGPPGEVSSRERSSALVAANLSIVAGLVHLVVTPEHVEEWWGYGVFFVSAAVFQLSFGIALLRMAGHRLVLAGIGLNVAIVALYVLSRTAGVPIGPHADHPEGVGLLDMSVTFAEVSLLFVLVPLLGPALRGRTMNAMLLTGGCLWALRVAGVLT